MSELVERLRSRARWDTMTNELEPKDHIDWQAADQLEQLQARVDKQQTKITKLTAALEFYADPATYYGIAFGPDLSTDFWGPFASDFGEDDTSKPGKKARETLKGVSDE